MGLWAYPPELSEALGAFRCNFTDIKILSCSCQVNTSRYGHAVCQIDIFSTNLVVENQKVNLTYQVIQSNCLDLIDSPEDLTSYCRGLVEFV